eukprot:TRINITY_DN14964_c0_g1_i1.p2 TRINITY_DN14964_c0_g1~~TRINITY_DN14964_c0_g1_i1.p2  ORF type:complete len:119 (+),score=7.89 TRINITY_DN14964_c0_g1_i1:29-358(+)
MTGDVSMTSSERRCGGSAQGASTLVNVTCFAEASDDDILIDTPERSVQFAECFLADSGEAWCLHRGEGVAIAAGAVRTSARRQPAATCELQGAPTILFAQGAGGRDGCT